MSRQHPPPPQRTRSRAYRQAFERLDAALERNTQSNNAEFIRRMRLTSVADGDALGNSGNATIPK